MQYTDLAAQLYAALTVDASTDADFATYLPRIIENAELRCYRDLDLMATRKTAPATIAAGVSTFSAPSDWLIGNTISIWPAGTTKRSNLDRRDDGYMREYWPDPALTLTTNPPKYWAEPTAGTLLIAPTADQAYTAELAYTFRPLAMSVANPETVLGDHYGDLFWCACMIEGTGYLKNFGAQSDNPEMAQSWTAQYDRRLALALNEEGRRKGDAYFDSSKSPPPSTITPKG